ncbi:hypothetical protein EVAR_41361_1 [Eumeta japonica]|uniref:Uncharacterized protein n=1 Tax=Eumeta variegata TaxID=151549 RepID=A0A4C1XM08_EUMVA|nr:hypothetical protein EVAR_41361_1 [Eumeta japonica]
MKSLRWSTYALILAKKFFWRIKYVMCFIRSVARSGSSTDPKAMHGRRQTMGKENGGGSVVKSIDSAPARTEFDANHVRTNQAIFKLNKIKPHASSLGKHFKLFQKLSSHRCRSGRRVRGSQSANTTDRHPIPTQDRPTTMQAHYECTT